MCYAHTKRPTQPISFWAHFIPLWLSVRVTECFSNWNSWIVCVCACADDMKLNWLILNWAITYLLDNHWPCDLWSVVLCLISLSLSSSALWLPLSSSHACCRCYCLLKFGRFFLIILSGVLRLSAYFLLHANRSPSVIWLSGMCVCVRWLANVKYFSVLLLFHLFSRWIVCHCNIYYRSLARHYENMFNVAVAFTSINRHLVRVLWTLIKKW